MPCEMCGSSIVTTRTGTKACAHCGRDSGHGTTTLRLLDDARENAAEQQLRLRIASSEHPTDTLPLHERPTLIDAYVRKARAAELDAARQRARAEQAECLARSRLSRLGDLEQQARDLRVERNHARAEAEHLRREVETLKARLQLSQV